MVKRFLISILVISSGGVYAADPEYKKYLEDSSAAQGKIDYSKNLLRHDKIDELIPRDEELSSEYSVHNNVSGDNEDFLLDAKNAKNNNDVELITENKSRIDDVSKTKKPSDKGKSSEESVSSLNTHKGNITNDTSLKDNVKINSKNKSHKNSLIYISPVLRNIGNDSEVRIRNKDNVKLPEVKKVVFGVTIGTKIEVVMDHSASNVQPGFVQFVTTKNVIGYKKTLPRNTRIFGKPSAISGTTKLFVTVSQGIVPTNHEEFTLNAIIFDEDGNPGLVAQVINDGRTLDRAVEAGTSALGGSIVNSIPGSVGIDVVKATAGQILAEKKSESNARNGRPIYIIEASPQKAIMQIGRTF